MALVGKPVILQVTGYQNSGKTELVKKILQQAAEKGLKIATIKHHGHGGKPDLIEEKDSAKHVSSGAMAAIVEGEGRLILQAEKSSWAIEEQIDILRLLKPDVIIIEGYKKENFSKIVILRNKNDLHLLKDLKNIIAVLYWGPLGSNTFTQEQLVEMKRSYPSFSFFNIHEESYMEWIFQYLYKLLNK